jgi:TATA-box binding protein (TBP) (component of TFIID and TFIIIB)
MFYIPLNTLYQAPLCMTTQMEFKPSEIKIATMTSISNLNTTIDIKVLGKFLTLDKTISEIRYKSHIKNKSGIVINRKPCFYNQVTVKISSGQGTIINMKIFSNGQIQMTGCRHEDNIKQAIDNITDIIYSINNFYSIKVYPENGLFIGFDDTIYYRDKIIGFKLSENKYSFDNEHVIYDGKYFVCCSDIIKSKSRNVYDNSGEIVGSQFLDFFDKDKKYKSKNIFINNNSILNSKKEHIGNITTEISPDILSYILPELVNETIVFRYKAVEPNSISNNGFKIVNINSVYDCFHEIKREQLFSVLQSIDIFSKFDPNSYPGVNIKFIYNSQKNGICSCPLTCRWVNGKPVGNNNICKKISIFVFQSGKIIITGGNSREQIDSTYIFINSIIKKYSHIIIKYPTPSKSSTPPHGEKDLQQLGLCDAELDFFNS